MTASLSPYINFPGTTREAMGYYQSVFGGETTFLTMGETDMPCEEMGISPDAIAHAELSAPNVLLRGSDAIEAGKIQLKSDTYSMAFVTEDESWARETFDRLAADGEVEMAMEVMSWGDLFGSVFDKYGVRWMFDITPQENN